MVIELLVVNRPSEGWSGKPEEKGRKKNLICGLHIVGQAVHLHYLDRANIGIPEKTSIYWMK